MGLFSRKPKVDLDASFKKLYKSVNQTTMQAQNELDDVIKESLYALVIKQYDDIIALIDQGAPYDKDHFLSLKENAQKEYQRIHDLNQE